MREGQWSLFRIDQPDHKPRNVNAGQRFCESYNEKGGKEKEMEKSTPVDGVCGEISEMKDR